MKTLEYLSDPALRSIFLPGVLAGLAIALFGGLLSVFVVMKRLAFIGQGISHAAFGGIGVAYVLGFGAAAVGGAGGSGAAFSAQLGIVFLFCLFAALQIGFLTSGDSGRRGGRGRAQADTAIGIVLVASMGLGSLLLHIAEKQQRVATVSWESLLFGSIVSVSEADAWAAGVVALLIVGGLFLVRRPLTFWTFDEPAAAAFGVNAGLMRFVLLVMLALATVTAMKLAGVVLATAMLVLPAAAAVQFSQRAGTVTVLSVLFALCAVACGMVLSFEFDWPTGASIVLVLAALFGIGWGKSRIAA
ncbi:MAG: metal ABC transporter permease [Phycisphaeraceae bacterium]|nr:metal ABC transporter permease [Phycisphaeraceae bacterium]